MSVIELNLTGWAVIRTAFDQGSLEEVRGRIFQDGEAGTRCLLDEPAVAKVAHEMRAHLVQLSALLPHSVAIQAIAFDKTPKTNWKVTWHQDVMFPFATAVRAPGYDLASNKGGVDYARPPRAVLEEMLAVRLHFDDCDETNGPLRVSPGSHTAGILRSAEIEGTVRRHGDTLCLARTGDALLMPTLAPPRLVAGHGAETSAGAAFRLLFWRSSCRKMVSRSVIDDNNGAARAMIDAGK